GHEPEAPRGPPPAPSDEEIALARTGSKDGPTLEEAIALLRRVRGTVREAPAVAAVLRASSAGGLPAPLRVACADILAARGDEREARSLLEGVTGTAGLVLAADLHAANGQLARAVGTIERVLARDIDAPGAKERHRRWRASLGFSSQPRRRLEEATL